MSIWTDGLPAWWAMAVAVAALLAGVWLGELHGRGVGRGQEREDRAAERAVRQVRSWRGAPGWGYRADLPHTRVVMPPEFHHEDPGMTLAEADEYWAGVAHEAWLAHTEQAMDLANDDPTVSAWTQQMAESMDAWLAEHVYSVPIPYLPGDEQR